MEIIILNSDIARLVLGYLQNQGLEQASRIFCKTSAYKQFLRAHSFFPDLEEIIIEYVTISRKVGQLIPTLLPDAFRAKLQHKKLSDKVSDLLERSCQTVLGESSFCETKNDLKLHSLADRCLQSDKENNKRHSDHCQKRRNDAMDYSSDELPSAKKIRSNKRVLEPFCVRRGKKIYMPHYKNIVNSPACEDVLHSEATEKDSSLDAIIEVVEASNKSVVSAGVQCNMESSTVDALKASMQTEMQPTISLGNNNGTDLVEMPTSVLAVPPHTPLIRRTGLTATLSNNDLQAPVNMAASTSFSSLIDPTIGNTTAEKPVQPVQRRRYLPIEAQPIAATLTATKENVTAMETVTTVATPCSNLTKVGLAAKIKSTAPTEVNVGNVVTRKKSPRITRGVVKGSNKIKVSKKSTPLKTNVTKRGKLKVSKNSDDLKKPQTQKKSISKEKKPVAAKPLTSKPKIHKKKPKKRRPKGKKTNLESNTPADTQVKKIIDDLKKSVQYLKRKYKYNRC